MEPRELSPVEVSEMISQGERPEFPGLMVPKYCLPKGMPTTCVEKGRSVNYGVLSKGLYRERVTLPSRSRASFHYFLLPNRGGVPSFFTCMISHQCDIKHSDVSKLVSVSKTSATVYTITFNETEMDKKFTSGFAKHAFVIRAICFLRDWRLNGIGHETLYNLASKKTFSDVFDRENSVHGTVILRYPESTYYRVWTKNKEFYDGLLKYSGLRHAAGLISEIYNEEISKQKALLDGYNTVLKLYFAEAEKQVKKILLRVCFRRFFLDRKRSRDEDSEVSFVCNKTIKQVIDEKMSTAEVICVE